MSETPYLALFYTPPPSSSPALFVPLRRPLDAVTSEAPPGCYGDLSTGFYTSVEYFTSFGSRRRKQLR